MNSVNYDDILQDELKNILITGKPGVGKTTAILKIIEQLKPSTVGGFWSREMLNRGKRVGFAIETLSGKGGALAHVDIFSMYKVGNYNVNVEDIDSIIVPELVATREAGKLIIIDEIARMELFSQFFSEELLRCLATGRVLGTIQEMTSHPFIREIKSRHDVKIIKITKSNRDWIPSVTVGALKKQYGEFHKLFYEMDGQDNDTDTSEIKYP